MRRALASMLAVSETVVYLLASTARPPRVVAYSDGLDLSLAREVQRANAFCELQRRLP